MTRLPAVRRLRNAVTGLRAVGSGRALVLIYHRVADLFSDPQLLAVRRRNFKDQMAVLSSRYHTVAVTELVDAIHGNSVKDGTVAVTFDDGYSDNLFNAKPILEEYGVPATVFVTSGYVGQDREYWWDELDRLLLQPGVLAEKLTLEIDGNPLSATIAPSEEYSEEQYGRLRSWNVLLECPTPRHRLYMSLCERLRPLGASVREDALEQLRAWAASDTTARCSHRPMTAEELRQLRRGALVDIGAHTQHHSLLAAQSLEGQRVEILGGKRDLEELCGCDIKTFSYPFGGKTTYSRGTVEIVQQSGFTGACANFLGRVRSNTDPLQLPRCLVRDWGGGEFKRIIDGWFHARM